MAVFYYACSDSNEYVVKSEFEPYVVRFENEASKRGLNLNLKSRGLIIEFAHLKDNVAGTSTFSSPVHIQIDKDHWNKLGNYAGADLKREEIIFHELGHGILQRKHLNTILPNDEWKSMMCGGDQVDDRTWNINYRGERRTYYLDELFNQSTSIPDFFTNPPIVDQSKFAVLLSENFDNNSSSIWKTGSNNGSLIAFENGMMKFQSLQSVSTAFLAQIPNFDIQSDYILQFTLQLPDPSMTAKYGMAVATATASESYSKSTDFFVIDNSAHLSMGNSNWYSFFAQVKRPQIIPEGKNRLKLVKTGEFYSFYINDEFAYSTEIENKQPGNGIGFIVPANTIIEVDDFILSVRADQLSALKIKKISTKWSFIALENIIHEDNTTK